MRVYFLHHSAVAVELDESLLVFDHYKNENKGLEQGSVSEEDLKAKQRVYVFVSHSHSDHFNKGIFKWANVNTDTVYILDSTVPAGKDVNCAVLTKGKTYEDGYIYVREFGSTDIGGSFFIRCEGKSFFHAGDFNYWHWRDDGDERYTRTMTKYFKNELENIKAEVSGVDYAFFPVDKRMGSGYDEGADMFIEAVKPKVFIPIHLKEFADSEAYSRKRFEGTKILPVYKNGQVMVTETFEGEKEEEAMFKIDHANINVTDIDASVRFYGEAFGLKEVRRIKSENFTIVFLSDGVTGFGLELTWLKDKEGPYDLGDNESHICFTADDFEAAYNKHKSMGIVCYENKDMGVYFIEDPDGYWQEVKPAKR
jgi:L-ascorbate metabolism protein UlaG (beta-lactamase superfamily)/catechol 2,3-dioxygenase-like lactoylglutathione lyase family enzyme